MGHEIVDTETTTKVTDRPLTGLIGINIENRGEAMRKDNTFSDKKLTREEFSKKYWQDEVLGETEYTYHAGDIEDARDEREQFVFNNIRGLKGAIDFHAHYNNQAHLGMKTKIKRMRTQIKQITILAATSTVIAIASLALVLINYLK